MWAIYPDSFVFLVAVTIVVISRLVYRKGVDLMAQVIAEICPRYPQVSKHSAHAQTCNLIVNETCITLKSSLSHDNILHIKVHGSILKMYESKNF
jgi:phosphatidylinositol glycan class A protein